MIFKDIRYCRKCGHLDLLFRRISKEGKKVGSESYFFLRVYHYSATSKKNREGSNVKFLTCNCIIFLGGLKTNHNWCTQFKYILNVTKVTVN